MMSFRQLAALSFLFAIVSTLSISVTASAQEVVVLGIRSFEGDEEFASNLTDTIRQSATEVKKWKVSDSDVTLEQVTLAQGCDEPDAACMEQISGMLKTQRIIYGTVRRTSTRDDYDHALSLYLFNGETNQIEKSLNDTIPRGETDVDDLRSRAARYVTELSGLARYGSLRVTVDQPGAEVSLDGESVGTTNENGELVLENLTAGTREVEVVAEGYEVFRSEAQVTPDERAELEVSLDKIGTNSGPNLYWLPGAILTVAGVAFLGVSFANMATVKGFDDAREGTDPDGSAENNYYQLRNSNSPEVENVCDGLDDTTPGGKACAQLDAAERNSLLFLGLGAVATVAGVALLIWGLGKGKKKDDTTALRLRPDLGFGRNGFSGRLQMDYTF